MNQMAKIGLITAAVVAGSSFYYVFKGQTEDYQEGRSEEFQQLKTADALKSPSNQTPNLESKDLVLKQTIETTLEAEPKLTSSEEQDLVLADDAAETQSTQQQDFKANLCANQGESRCLIYDVTQVENELVISADTMHLNKAMVVLDSQNLEELIDYMNATASIAEQEYTEKFNQRLESMATSEVSVSPLACGEKICFLTMTYQDKTAWEGFADQLFFGDDAISYNIGQKPQKTDENGLTEVRYFFSYDPNLKRFISI
jgi:hypothetical protein